MASQIARNLNVRNFQKQYVGFLLLSLEGKGKIFVFSHWISILKCIFSKWLLRMICFLTENYYYYFMNWKISRETLFMAKKSILYLKLLKSPIPSFAFTKLFGAFEKEEKRVPFLRDWLLSRVLHYFIYSLLVAISKCHFCKIRWCSLLLKKQVTD